MPTETLPTRAESPTQESLSRGFWLALSLHGVALAGLIAAAWIGHSSHHWGDQDPTAGSVQASMVNSLPLPSKQRYLDKSVLASEHASAAPTPMPPAPNPRTAAPERAEPIPKPNEVLIPSRTPTKPSATDRTQPSPSSRVPTPTPPTPKATTGDSGGIQIPQSITQLKNGTAMVTVDERTFGDRYAYYIRLIAQKINESKSEGDPDGADTRGKKTVIRFTIQRDGTPVDAAVIERSGSASLDTSTLRAIQRIDTFGALPQGDHLTVRFEYDSK